MLERLMGLIKGRLAKSRIHARKAYGSDQRTFGEIRVNMLQPHAGWDLRTLSEVKFQVLERDMGLVWLFL